ncbi:MAG: WecB/TagA/CpsF family glycosyltransferase [Alphaproteobacteria bacterium]|nr:WecB/TagA/CpsF family glycosyltransferase [Alphaproteobacteria bacterium]
MSSDGSSRVCLLLEKTFTDSKKWSLESLALSDKQAICVAFLNAHAVTLSYSREEIFTPLMSSDFLLRDGIGVKLALKLFGYADTENLNGTDLIPKILNQFSGKEISIWGASDVALTECKRKLAENHINNIVSLEHGFHDPEHYVRMAEERNPEIVVLCMGMPKQEKLAKILQERNLCRLVICGGGWADFYSENKKRAPLWVRKISMEWLHRLVCEPRRLGRRYTLGILDFFYIIIKTYASRRPSTKNMDNYS